MWCQLCLNVLGDRALHAAPSAETQQQTTRSRNPRETEWTKRWRQHDNQEGVNYLSINTRFHTRLYRCSWELLSSSISGPSDVERETELRRTALACGRRLYDWNPSSKPIMHRTVSHTFCVTLLFLNTYLDTLFISLSRTQHMHNIAEELDPTFKAKKRESQISTSPPSGTSTHLYRNKLRFDITSHVFVLCFISRCVSGPS